MSDDVTETLEQIINHLPSEEDVLESTVTGDPFIDYTMANFELETGEELIGGTPIDAHRMTWAMWAVYTGVFDSQANTKAMGSLRHTVSYNHLISSGLLSYDNLRKDVGSLLSEEDEELFALGVAELAFQSVRLGARIGWLYADKLNVEAVEKVHAWYNDSENQNKLNTLLDRLEAQGIDVDDLKNQRTELLTHTAAGEVLNRHKKFLDDIDRAITQSGRDITDENQLLTDYNQILQTQNNNLNRQISDIDLFISDLEEQRDRDNTRLETVLTELENSDLNTEQKQQLEAERDALHSSLAAADQDIQNKEIEKQNKQGQIDQNNTIIDDNNNTIYQNDEEDLRNKVTLDNFVKPESALAKDAKHYVYNQIPQKLSNGVMDSLGAVTGALALTSTVLDENATDTEIASASLFFAGASMEAIATMIKFGLGGKIPLVNGDSGFNKFMNAAGAVTSAAGAGTALAALAEQLENENLTPEQETAIRQEIAIQSTVLALGALSGGLLIAGAQMGGGWASFAKKIVPVLGITTALIDAFNPTVIQAIREKEDLSEALAESDEYSAQLLSDLLGDSADVEKVFHGVISGVEAIGNAASIAAGPFGALFGIGTAVLSGLLQWGQGVKLRKIAAGIEEQMRTDGNGNEQSIEEFFEGSFDDQQEQVLAQIEGYFDELLEGQSLDAIVALGSQTLTEVDRMLAGMTETFDEVGQTVKHYFEEYYGDGNWSDEGATVTERDGNDLIEIDDHNGEEIYLTFTTPLMASVADEYAIDPSDPIFSASDDQFVRITDLAGWEVQDAGTNNTVFNASQVINTFTPDGYVTDQNGVRLANGVDHHVDFIIQAGAGDDTYLAYESIVTFYGGEGRDTASYINLAQDTLPMAQMLGGSPNEKQGIVAIGNADGGLTVTKYQNAEAEYFVEQVFSEPQTSNDGKDTSEIQYRDYVVRQRGEDTAIKEDLFEIEVLQGTFGNDLIDASGYSALEEVHTFNGNDVVIGSENTFIVSLGAGDDTIDLNDSIFRLFNDVAQEEAEAEAATADQGEENTGEENAGEGSSGETEEAQIAFVYMNGGNGKDTFEVRDDMLEHLLQAHTDRIIDEEVSQMLAVEMTAGLDDGAMASLFANQLWLHQYNPYLRVIQEDVEFGKFTLKNTPLYNEDTLRLSNTATFANAIREIYTEVEAGVYFLPILTYVERGLAYAIVDPIAAESYRIYSADNCQLTFLPFKPTVSFEVALILPALRPASQITQHFVDYLTDEFRRIGGRMRG